MAKGRISVGSRDGFTCTPGKVREFLWDTEMVGFGIVAYPKGYKAFVIRYRIHGKQDIYPFATCGQMQPTEARKVAQALFQQVALGHNPKTQRKAPKEGRTFQEVGNDFLELYAKKKLKPTSASGYKQALTTHLYPAFGKKPMREITHADVEDFHAALEDRKYAANKAVRVLSSIWTWAARRREVEKRDNPTDGLELYREEKRIRYATDDEYQRLGATLTLAETEGLPWTVDTNNPNSKHTPKKKSTIADPYAVAAIRLLIFTGARKSEILTLEWTDVDLEKGIINLKDSKGGKRPIYLNSISASILSNIEKREGCPFVIAGNIDGKARFDIRKPWEAIKRTAKLHNFRIHDLRHSFATAGMDASQGLGVVGQLLGHKDIASTIRYAHFDTDPVRRANETIGERIDRAFNPKKLEPQPNSDYLFSDDD